MNFAILKKFYHVVSLESVGIGGYYGKLVSLTRYCYLVIVWVKLRKCVKSICMN